MTTNPHNVRLERLVRASWLAVALVHVTPASVFFAPSLTGALYGLSIDGDAATLLTHRGALFLAVVLAAVMAAIDRRARQLASIVAGTSLIGYLIVFVRDGMPDGPLTRLALVDSAALIPLAFASYRTWIADRQ